MATINLSAKYRPLRVGFLVKENHIEDIVKAAELNTLLWGGIYNPIIPVGDNKPFDEQLIKIFSVDTFFKIDDSNDKINEIVNEYPYLKDP